MEILGKGMHIKKGTEMIGFWGAMHPYRDGVVVDVDAEYITIDWGYKTGVVQLIRFEELKGNWYNGKMNGVGIYDATMETL